MAKIISSVWLLVCLYLGSNTEGREIERERELWEGLRKEREREMGERGREGQVEDFVAQVWLARQWVSEWERERERVRVSEPDWRYIEEMEAWRPADPSVGERNIRSFVSTFSPKWDFQKRDFWRFLRSRCFVGTSVPIFKSVASKARGPIMAFKQMFLLNKTKQFLACFNLQQRGIDVLLSTDDLI